MRTPPLLELLAEDLLEWQLERIGAAKAFKPFAIESVKAILRGGTKKFLKTAKLTGVGIWLKVPSSEFLTEIGQDLVQTVASGNEFNFENMFEAGATGFIVAGRFTGHCFCKISKCC